MLLDVIASCCHVASCSPIASCRLSRRAASRCLPSRVSWSVVLSSSHRVVAASPHLSRRCRLLRYYIVVFLSSPIAPLLLVGCCVCPLSRSPQSLALRRVASSPLTRGTVAALLPHLSHRCIASCSHVDWVSSCVDHRLTFLRRPGTQAG